MLAGRYEDQGCQRHEGRLVYEAIDALLPDLEGMIGNGLITVESIRMIRVARDHS